MSGTGEELESLNRKKIGFTEPQYTGVPVDTYNDRYEKPWQRVVSGITKKGLHLYEPVRSVPNAFIVLLLAFYLLIGFFTQLVEDNMPSVVPEADIQSNEWDRFSEETALKYLDVIIGDEPRVSGTPYHLQKTKDLHGLINHIAAKATGSVSTAWQLTSDEYKLDLSATLVNHYVNVSNIIAILEGESGFNFDGTTNTTLLVNCHYDSVPFALGASDNAVFCAVLVESLSRLARRTKKFRNNIVFLFNGAEENMLQGSHAFLSHPWAQGVTAVINLDSAGMNGKPSVFQVTDPRILDAYHRGANRPSAQAVGEFLFRSGIVPSDTDFRIFRDFGHIQGIDIAFTKWGHVYHTRYDEPSLILPGVMQNAGQTVLAALIHAADADLDDKIPPSAVVYVDYLNLFMVVLSYPAALAADIAIAILGFVSVAYYVWLVGFRWSTITELLWCLLGRTGCLVVGSILTVLLTVLAVATTVQMRYLSQAWIIIPMFWLPYFVGAVAASHYFDHLRYKKGGLNRSIRTLQAMAATRGALAAAVLVLCCLPSAAPLRYVFSVPLLLMSLASFVTITAVRCLRMQGWQHLVMEVMVSVPSAMFLSQLALRLTAMMVPVMGRAGNPTPDLLIGALSLAMALLHGVLLSGIELLFSRRRIWVPLVGLLAACLVISLVPFSPYQDSGPATQRHSWFHSEMVSHDINKTVSRRQAGVLVTYQDPYSTSDALSALDSNGIRLNSRADLWRDCANATYCGLPLYRVTFIKALHRAVFLYTEPPSPLGFEPDVHANKTCSSDLCTYHFSMPVTPHTFVTLCPRPGVNVTAWSLRTELAVAGWMGDRPIYQLLHSVATYQEKMEDLRLSVTIKVGSEAQARPALDVGVHWHLAHHPQQFTAQYRRLLAAAPAYFNVATFISHRHDFVF
ncbi:hypothetical protein ACJJTC_007397 [Scirpophaga incertulas]